MRRFLSSMAIAALLVVGTTGAVAAPGEKDKDPMGAPNPKDPEAGGIGAALRKHVDFLAGPDLKGRGAWEDRKKAADYVAKGFEQAGFKPLPGRTSYFVDHGGTPEQPEIRNVCAWWPEPPKTAKEAGDYVLLSAHYDHLGVRNGNVYPGADDNASGVAVMLEAARTFVGREALVLRIKPLPRALCLVAFDLEEKGLIGSRRFAAEPPVPLEKCTLFLTMDQMGRSLADLEPGLLFLMGSEHCACVERSVLNTTVEQGIRRCILGIDFQPPTGYSDYVAFQEKKVPFLFISTGACGHYHQPGDTPEKLDYPRMVQHTTYVRDLTTLALGAEEPFAWKDPGEPRIQEIQTVRDLVGLAVPKMETMGVPDGIKLMVTNFLKYVEDIIARGKVTPDERTAVRDQGRRLFQMAVALQPR
jgi:hypothetical protein